MKHPIRKLVGCYGCATLLFAVFYWSAWNTLPDAFLVNDEFNRYPTADLEEMGAVRPSDEKFFSGSDNYQHSSALTAELRVEAQKLKDEWRKNMNIRKGFPAKREALKKLDSQVTDELAKSRAAQSEAYESKQMKAYYDREQELSKALEEADKKVAKETSPIARLPLIEIAGQAKIDLMNAKVSTAAKSLEVKQHIVRNYGSFGDPQLLEKSRAVFNQLTAIEDEEMANHRAFSDLTDKARELLRKQRESIRNRIGFVDFLYFSMGVATTTTFGDIIPNARRVRLLVVIQLLVCTAIFTWLLSHLGEIVTGKPGRDSKD
jgi:hypothetical protein